MQVKNTLISSAVLASVMVLPVAAQSNDGFNQVFIEQNGSGNNLTIDQSRATGAQVRGLYNVPELQLGTTALSISEAPAARQQGDDNDIDIIQSGQGSVVLFNQSTNGQVSTGLVSNDANVVVGAGSLGLLNQNGIGNSATLNVGLNSQGLIAQEGNDNTGTLNVDGGASGTLLQQGNGNDAGVVNVGGVSTSVTYIQQGNGLAPAPGTGGVTVQTNAAAVTITQSAFGGN